MASFIKQKILSNHSKDNVITPDDCFYKMTGLFSDHKLVDEDLLAQNCLRWQNEFNFEASPFSKK